MPELAALAERAVRNLRQAGFTAYWAGGCVRDRLLGRNPKDYDIATDARPDQVMPLFPGAVAVGKAFGVVRAPVDGVYFEVATFRRESGYSDGRRPDRVAFCGAREDAQRRDFTVNALFMDPLEDRVIDFVGGRRDLEQRVIRAVGDPALRFAEDHLRMLRAARFCATLDFSIEPATAEAVRANAPSLARISAERVRDELTRLLLEARSAGQGVRLLEELGLLAVILPEVQAMRAQRQPPQFHPEGDVLQHTILMLDMMQERSLVLAFAVLFHDVGKPITAAEAEDRLRFDGHACSGASLAEAIMRRLRFPNDDIRAVCECVGNHMRFMDVQRMRPATLRKLVGNPLFEQELELHRLDCLASHGSLDNYEFLVNFQAEMAAEPVLPQPWVSGHDIMAMGVEQGPAVGRWRRTAYEAQLEGRFASREALVEWLRGQIDRIGR